MKTCYILLTTILLTCSQSWLFGEIEYVIVRWTSLLCEGHCMSLLEQQFRQLAGVEEISLSPGQAVLKWKRNVLFDLYPLKMAVRMVGLSIRDLRIKVKGRIQHDTQSVFLISSGDNTRFVLLHPVMPDPQRQAPQYNFAARSLNPALRQKLLEIEANQLIATVEGPIFMPERSPPDPMAIVADHVNVTRPPNPNER